MKTITLRHRCFVTHEAVEYYKRTAGVWKNGINTVEIPFMTHPDTSRIVHQEVIIPIIYKPGGIYTEIEITELVDEV